MLDRRTLIRRGFHMLSSLFVVYYWLPEYLDPLELTRNQVAILGLALLTAFEAYRIHRGWLFFGLRDYEKKRVAGYYWGASGYVIALLLFEQRFAMITILGTTLTDPVLGELRKAGRIRAALAAGLGVWTAIALSCIFLVPLSTPLVLVPLRRRPCGGRRMAQAALGGRQLPHEPRAAAGPHGHCGTGGTVAGRGSAWGFGMHAAAGMVAACSPARTPAFAGDERETDCCALQTPRAGPRALAALDVVPTR